MGIIAVPRVLSIVVKIEWMLGVVPGIVAHSKHSITNYPKTIIITTNSITTSQALSIYYLGN